MGTCAWEPRQDDHMFKAGQNKKLPKVILMLFERVNFVYLCKLIYKGRLISCCCFLKVMEVRTLETFIALPPFE